MAVAVVIVNVILQMIIIPLVESIGLHRKTLFELYNCIIIVVCQFSDTIMIPLAVAMNFKEYGMTSFTGNFSDIEAGWYTQVGGHVFTTMIIFTFNPVIEYVIEVISTKVGNCCGGKPTEKDFYMTDYLSFIEKFAGPEYLFFLKVATTNLTLLCCFIMGGCMPAFYLIGMAAIAIQYIMDRYLLARHFRRPPMYSEIMTLNTFEIISWIPLVTLFLQFWCYTNQQMFDNKIDPI